MEPVDSDPGDPRLDDGIAWEAFCEALRRAGARLLESSRDAPPRARAEGFRHLARFLASGLVSTVTHDDPDHPVFGRMIDYTRPWGLDNPDCLYLYAPLRGGESYRVWGTRGSACHIDFQVNWGHYASGEISAWGTVSSLDGSELATDAEGRFELWIGPERREGQWLATRPDAQFLLVRQYFDDWEGERPADLAIEREGAAWPIPPPRGAAVADRLEKLARWVERGGALWQEMSRGFRAMEPNSLLVHEADAAGERTGLRGQAYGMGCFECGAGEAVVVEFAPPPCRYWGIALANELWECVEYASRQSSLNRNQARLDADGAFRGVIAHEDPGVPNWLDPGATTRGTIALRFLHAQERVPKPAFRRVPFAALREALPPDTPAVAPEERAAALARRRHAVLRRYRQ